ncbi:MAG TPA: aspartate carbamoyltransferase catalytic subunit [Vicinamibacterales bacterium]|nr:aspartate carbamoyltransferase catalytic subunit [Vicinamibacterales bacterium]
MNTTAAGQGGAPAVPEIAPATLRSRHLLGIDGLDAAEITLILDTAEAMKEIGTRSVKKVPTLRGRTVVNLFFEPSTRTRTSFEIAEKRLSADTLSIATATSSVTKGESLLDTVRNIEAMAPDMIVMRHGSSGAPHLLARTCRSAIVNAGDGMHEHPTQALLDAFTIREHKKRLAGLKVAIVGDLMHSRVLRSNLLLLKTMGARVWACGPATLVPVGLDRLGARPTTSIDDALDGADVVMMLRIQQERMHGHFFPSVREYFSLFGLTRDRLRRAASDVIVMHPGPMNRGVEIDSEVADGPGSVILEQVANGVAVRMAVLYLLAGRETAGGEG